MSSLTRYLKLVKPAIDEVYDINIFNNNYDKIDKAIGESVTSDPFVSEDESDPEELATMPEVMADGDDRATLFNKISVVVKNVRYLIKLIGNTDISEIGEGTITDILSSFNQDFNSINTSLSDFEFRVNTDTGKNQYSSDGGVTWINMGGGSMRVVKNGTISTTSTINLDESIDVDKYFVLINTSSAAYNTSNSWTSYGMGAYMSAKTSVSFTITVSSGITANYQVIAVD